MKTSPIFRSDEPFHLIERLAARIGPEHFQTVGHVFKFFQRLLNLLFCDVSFEIEEEQITDFRRSQRERLDPRQVHLGTFEDFQSVLQGTWFVRNLQQDRGTVVACL